VSVYLDWAATSPPDREILSAATESALEFYGNPSSVHAPGKAAKESLEASRARCARVLAVPPEAVVFTSGGTEANHVPMLSLLQRPVRGSIAISAIEHPSVSEQARMLALLGWETLVIPVTKEGFVTTEAVLSTIREDTAFVAVMAVNNETGAVQDIKAIASALLALPRGRKKPHFHVDAVQAIGKVPVELSFAGIDSASISAHKIRGPRGIGLLYLPRRIEPFARGGGQESGIRPGTENLAGAVALALALERHCAASGKACVPRGTEGASRTMARIIGSIVSSGIGEIVPQSREVADPRFSPYVLQCTNKRLPGEVLVRALSDRGVFVSTGSACSSKKKGRPVLNAMRLSADAQQNAFRVSIGNETTEADADRFIEALGAVMSAM
jgi:cysteine desulfurase